MAPRKQAKRKRRAVRSSLGPQNVVIQGYGTLNANDKTNIVVLTMDSSGNNRDFRPVRLHLQVSGTVGATFILSLRDGEGSSARTFGPFLVGSAVRQMNFSWPMVQWFSAGRQAQLVKVRCLPRQGITTQADNITVIMKVNVLLSDYNSGLTLHPPTNNLTIGDDEDFSDLGAEIPVALIGRGCPDNHFPQPQ